MISVIEVYSNSFYNEKESEVGQELTKANANNKAVKVISKEIARLKKKKYKNPQVKANDDIEERRKMRQHNKEINARIDELKEYKRVSNSDKEKLTEQLKCAISKSDNQNQRELKLTDNEIFVSTYNDILENAGLLNESNKYDVKTKENTWTGSQLTRAIEKHRPFMNDDIVVINRGQKLNDKIFAQITEQGFSYNNQHYIFYSSSSNELKNGQATFIKEEIYNKIEMTLTCGLTIDEINQKKDGMNTNKYMAYKSLAKSSSREWEDFNIDEAIVVDDIEFDVKGKEVDYIHHQTLEQQLIGEMPVNADTIERKIMDIPYNFTDGMAITCDKTLSNRIFRFPWGKGLMTYDNYRNFIRQNGCKGHIKDIWGKEYSITDFKNGKIKYIFFKSTFKMADFYSSWDDYKERFKKYGCEMSIVEDEPYKPKRHRPLNYQMLQQLNAVATDEEIKELAKMSLESISKIGNDLDTTLRLFGAVKDNEEMTDFQKALLRYKPLMKSDRMKKKIKDLKASQVKDFKAGKIEFDAVMTFVVPDIMVINQWLFKGEHDIYNMADILSENDVICDSFVDGRVDVLRSPSLGFEHNVMNITTPIKGYKKNYYKTRAIYTSAKSLLSKVIFFDNDGDKLYVVKNDTLCDMVDNFKKQYDIVPLYFEMEKAKSVTLNAKSLTEGMLSAFSVNIGEWSNPISKLWDTLDNKSSEVKVKETLKLINLFVMYNNFAIDSAKTNFMPQMSEYVAEQQEYYKSIHTKLPHFFYYAKDKDKRIIKETGTGFVDKLERVYKTNRNNFMWSMTEGFKKTQYDEAVLTNGEDIKINLDDKEQMKKLYENIVANTTDKMKICPTCGTYFSYKTDDKQCQICRGVAGELA